MWKEITYLLIIAHFFLQQEISFCLILRGFHVIYDARIPIKIPLEIILRKQLLMAKPSLLMPFKGTVPIIFLGTYKDAKIPLPVPIAS